MSEVNCQSLFVDEWVPFSKFLLSSLDVSLGAYHVFIKSAIGVVLSHWSFLLLLFSCLDDPLVVSNSLSFIETAPVANNVFLKLWVEVVVNMSWFLGSVLRLWVEVLSATSGVAYWVTFQLDVLFWQSPGTVFLL